MWVNQGWKESTLQAGKQYIQRHEHMGRTHKPEFLESKGQGTKGYCKRPRRENLQRQNCMYYYCP